MFSDLSSLQNSVLKMSEYDQDHKMIMFSLQVDCELNVSVWQPRSIALPFFFFFFTKFPLAEAIKGNPIYQNSALEYRIF